MLFVVVTNRAYRGVGVFPVRSCALFSGVGQAKGAAGTRREWEPEELIAAWTLLDSDWDLVGNKTGATRLGSGLLLKFFEQEGRFPHGSLRRGDQRVMVV
ncbi:hypothetical protein HTZ77_17915 [Nonomuraea sp. SMC257]|uniref:Uncharacterized protein n=1 Tax=Nonomuraea montanisoli TaxID=2741721 RepID=A0A7Y6I8S8_9ACTN|nr:hypothetical protein [Nonomuraea montanisoli]NUW33293.1 hypothetical protein [Nonomuraea montanisoli]